MRNWVSSIIIVVLDLVVVNGQETLYGLPPIPGEPLPSTTTKLPTTHRLFRFGPFLPYIHHHSPLPHPTLPPFLAHPFDTYNNINPIPELPPQPEAKYNGYYDLDGNFVSYGSDRARGYGAKRPKREVDSKDEALRRKLLEEEYAYDDEEGTEKKTTVSTTTKGITTTTIQTSEKSTTTSSNTDKSSTTISPTTEKSTTLISEAQNTTTKSTETPKTTTQKSTPVEVKPTQIPTRPLFVSGNARPRHHSNIVQNDTPQKPKVQSKIIDHSVTFKAQDLKPQSQTNKKPIQINSQQFAKGLIIPRQHQRPIQKRPPPSLQAKFINTHKKTRTQRPLQKRPKLPSRQPVAFTRKPLKTHQRQFQPAPLKAAPQFQNQFPPQQQAPQFIPFQQQQRAWAAPAVIPDNREPQVIAYLKDVEDYDWSYTGERPNLEGPVLAFQRQNGVTAPETLVPLNNRQQALVASTLAPYIPPRATQPPSYTAPPPAAQTPSYTLSPFAPAPGGDPFGFFSGTPHPLLDVRRIFGGGLFGGR